MIWRQSPIHSSHRAQRILRSSGKYSLVNDYLRPPIDHRTWNASDFTCQIRTIWIQAVRRPTIELLRYWLHRYDRLTKHYCNWTTDTRCRIWAGHWNVCCQWRSFSHRLPKISLSYTSCGEVCQTGYRSFISGLGVNDRFIRVRQTETWIEADNAVF